MDRVSSAYRAFRLSLLIDLVNEPEPKRKTLVERAGETKSIVAATPSSRALVKGTSIVCAGVSFPKYKSFTLPSQHALFPMADRRRLKKRTPGYGSPLRLGCFLINIPSKEVGTEHYHRIKLDGN